MSAAENETTYRAYTAAIHMKVCFGRAEAACRLEILLASESDSDGFLEYKKREGPNGIFNRPLLLGNRDISAEAHKALAENRLQDAATILMEENGRSCVEVGYLLDVLAC